ncbi:MAG: ornithine cyclodeaminase [Pseudomonadota bacterium]|nr:ornithine cyclodeaminase [Pseudomonadota bacterium]
MLSETVKTSLRILGPELTDKLNWADAVEALRTGHTLPRAAISDMLMPMTEGELLTRSAAISGLGAGTKSVTIRPNNPALSPPAPSVQGLFTLFDEDRGQPVALIDGALLTLWKTVADSLLGARYLAPSDAKSLAVIGTGPIAKGLLEGYVTLFPDLTDIRIWGRTRERAQAHAEAVPFPLTVCDTAENAVRGADIVTSATASRSPVIKGNWVKPGAHVDLVGAHGPDMREADDLLISSASLFVDSRETVLEHIGEFRIPIEKRLISPANVQGDLYDLVMGDSHRRGDDEITLFKNGGGAHLDLMMACYCLEQAN